MTLPAAIAHIEYTAAGSATFVYPFQIDLPSELEVRVDGTVMTETVHYTVAGVSVPTGGTVTFFQPPQNGTTVSLRRVVDIEQLLDLVPNAALPAVALEDQLDEIVKQIQMLEEVDSRTPSLPVGTSFDLRYLEFPPPGNGMTIGWNADGSALTLFPSNVQDITINPVSGVGSGKVTIAVTPTGGTAQASVVVFPPTVLGIAITIWIETGFTGLEAIGIGTPESPDKWGYLTQLTTDTETTAGLFQSYTAQPQLNAGTITLTAYGGLFTGTGTAYITGHFLTFDPSHTEGLSFTPGTPGESMPFIPATETEAGIAELATSAETFAGTDDTRIVTPLKLAGRLAALPTVPPATESVAGIAELATSAEVTTGTDDTRIVTPLKLAERLTEVHSGTALSVTRYTAAGTAQESVPGLLTTAAGNLQIGSPVTVAGNALQTAGGNWRQVRDGANATFMQEVASNPLSASCLWITTRALGTEAARTAIASGTTIGGWIGRGWDGAAFGDAALVAMASEEAFTSTTRGGRLALSTTALGTTTMTERVRIDSQGRIGLHTTLSATLGSGASYQPLSVKGSQLFVGQSTVQERAVGAITSTFAVATDASRTGRLIVSAYDATAAREGLRVEADGAAPRIGFLGATAVVRQTASAAATDPATTQTLANSLRTALINLGLTV